MHRIDHSTAVALKPAPGVSGEPGYFTKGDPSGGFPATVVTADWANAVQEEIATAIEGVGIVLDKSDPGQLSKALTAIRLATLEYLSQIGGADSVGYTAEQTVKDQLDMLYHGMANVMDKKYAGGADPTGVADSYAAVKAAAASGKVVYFPPGNFSYTPGQAPINVISRRIHGAGIYQSNLAVAGINTQTTIFTNEKTSADAWGTGGKLEIRDMSFRGNWDGATALADQSWDNTAGLVKFGAAAGVRIVDVSFSYSFGHNASFFPLGYANFTRVKSFTARKHNLHLEATSGAVGVTSTWITNCDFNSARGFGNVYIKNGVGVWITGNVFEDSLCGVYLDGNDNRNVTIENNHAETHPNGLLHFVGSGQNTVYSKNFGDSSITRTNPTFQKLYAHSNQNGFNGIEEGFGPILMDFDIGNGAGTARRFGFYGTANFLDVVGRMSWRTNNNFDANTPVAEIRAMARGNANQAYGALEFGTGFNGLTYRARLDESGHFYPLVDNAYSCGASGQRWSAVWSATASIQTSDRRAKTEITDSPLGLAFIEALRPVSYKYKIGRNVVDSVEVGIDEEGNRTFEDRVTAKPGTRAHFGLIAQEVREALPDGVDFGGWVLSDIEKPDSEQGLRYEQFVAPLIKAVQELAEQRRMLSAALEELSARVLTLESK